MDFAEQNKARVVEYFAQGSHAGAPVVGVEVEHFLLFSDGTPLAYEPCDGRIGVRNVVEHLLGMFPQPVYNTEGDLMGCSNDLANITLEPSAQLEISLAPFASIAEVGRVYAEFRADLDGFLVGHDAHVITAGYNPTRRAEQLTLIPKKRYRYMDAYFREKGTEGKRMMRASASTQVSVDYADEADAVRKMRIASALAPVLAAITDNTQAFEGEPNVKPLAHLEMWRHVDSDRAGVVPGVFDEGFGFAAYADWLFSKTPIFVTRASAADPQGPTVRNVAGQTAMQAYADAPMDKDDIEHLLSMFWPDVRLKRFVEIRPADSLPQELMQGYAALVKGIFYSDAAMAGLEQRLGVEGGAWPLADADVENAIAAVRSQGYDAVLYGVALREWIVAAFELAAASLGAEEAAFLEPLRAFALGHEWKLG